MFVLEDERALFTGDVVIGTGTVVVAPPGGDMRTYQRTLQRLRDEYGDAHAIYGGHGPEVRDVRAKLDEYIAHRENARAADRRLRSPAAPNDPRAGRARLRRHRQTAVARRGAPDSRVPDRARIGGPRRAEPSARAPTPREAALLDPDLSKLGDDAGADVIRAELGYGNAEPLLRYAPA